MKQESYDKIDRVIKVERLSIRESFHIACYMLGFIVAQVIVSAFRWIAHIIKKLYTEAIKFIGKAGNYIGGVKLNGNSRRV